MVKTGQTVKLTFVPRSVPFALANMTNKTLDQAKQELAAQGLVVGTITNEVNANVQLGSVTRTDPPAGQEVKQGDTINLFVSSGPGQVNVPSVANLSEADATKLLQGPDYGFGVDVREQASPTVADGNAIGTNPAAGTPVNKGSKITLFVSTGPSPVAVPPVTGLTEAQARNALESKGLVVEVGSPLVVAPGDPNVGRVVRQSVASGVQVPPGTKVQIQLGVAAATTTTTPPTTTTTPPTTTTTPPTTTTSSATTTSHT
jgi:serine/threonine-protein kinase